MIPLAGLLLAVVVTLEGAGPALRVEAAGDPAADVLAAIRLASGVKLMLDATIETEPCPVTVSGRFDDGPAAVRAVAAAAGLEAEASGDVILVRRPPHTTFGAGRKDAPGKSYAIETDARGRFYATGALTYPVTVLRDRPEDQPARADLAGFENRKGISLVIAPQLRERAIREYLEARPIYREILARAGLPIALASDLDERSARIYVEADRGRYLAEIRFAAPGSAPGAPEIVHFVFDLEVQSTRCRMLSIFTTTP